MAKKPEPLSREQSLDAVVVASSAISIREREDGCITLGIPFRPTPFIAWLSRKLGVATDGERPLELDEIGSFVWRMFDGRTTVRQMIARLSEDYKLNRKDAEVSLTAFIRNLVKKRLVVLALRKK
jgi:hypothetical protein